MMSIEAPTRRARLASIAASAAPVLLHGPRHAEIVLLDGTTCTRSVFGDWTETALRHDGSADPELQTWCDEILTVAGYAPTYAERRLAAARAVVAEAPAPSRRRMFVAAVAIAAFAVGALSLVLIRDAAERYGAAVEQSQQDLFMEASK